MIAHKELNQIKPGQQFSGHYGQDKIPIERNGNMQIGGQLLNLQRQKSGKCNQGRLYTLAKGHVVWSVAFTAPLIGEPAHKSGR